MSGVGKGLGKKVPLGHIMEHEEHQGALLGAAQTSRQMGGRSGQGWGGWHNLGGRGTLSREGIFTSLGHWAILPSARSEELDMTIRHLFGLLVLSHDAMQKQAATCTIYFGPQIF